MNTEEKLIKRKKIFRNLFIIGLLISTLSFISIFVIILLPVETFEPLFEIIHSYEQEIENNETETENIGPWIKYTIDSDTENIEFDIIEPDIESNEMEIIEPEIGNNEFEINENEIDNYLFDLDTFHGLSNDTQVISSWTISSPFMSDRDIEYENYKAYMTVGMLFITIIISFVTAFMYAGLESASEKLEKHQIKLIRLQYIRKVKKHLEKYQTKIMINRFNKKERKRFKQAHKCSPELNWFHFEV